VLVVLLCSSGLIEEMKVDELELVNRLFAKAFEATRDKRSDPYKRGVYDGLVAKLETITTKNPFTLGTADADAWFAGNDEGRRRGQAWLDDNRALAAACMPTR
jgi:hypothetical protein